MIARSVLVNLLAAFRGRALPIHHGARPRRSLRAASLAFCTCLACCLGAFALASSSLLRGASGAGAWFVRFGAGCGVARRRRRARGGATRGEQAGRVHEGRGRSRRRQPAGYAIPSRRRTARCGATSGKTIGHNRPIDHTPNRLLDAVLVLVGAGVDLDLVADLDEGGTGSRSRC